MKRKTPLPIRRNFCFRQSLAAALLLAALLTGWLGIQKVAYLQLDVASPRDCNIQLYYDIGDGFNEQHSKIRGIKGINTFLTLRFGLPEARIKALRLDFDSDTAIIRIANIRLADQHDVIVKKMDIHRLTAQKHIASIQYADGKALVLSNGDDPQMAVRPFITMQYVYTFRPGLFFSLTLIFYGPFWMLFFFGSRFFAAGNDTSPPEAGKASAKYCMNTPATVFLVASVVTTIAAALCFIMEKKELESVEVYRAGHQLVPLAATPAGRNVRIKREDGIYLAGSLFDNPSFPGPKTPILLLHGNYWEGCGFPLYPLLADNLAQRGYVVLTFSFADYGKSDDPFLLGRPSAIDLDIDTRAALSYLRGRDNVDREHMLIIGHSMGANPALRVGVQNDAVKAIVLIGPPRRVFDQFESPLREHYWARTLLVRKHKTGKAEFPSWYPEELWQQQNLEHDIVHYIPYFSKWEHKPLLLIDGELEEYPDRIFLNWFTARLTHPKAHRTLMRVNHNCNILEQDGRVMYDPVAIEQAADILDRWIVDYRYGKRLAADYFNNILHFLFAPDLFEEALHIHAKIPVAHPKTALLPGQGSVYTGQGRFGS